MISDTAIVSAFGFGGVLVTQVAAICIVIVQHRKITDDIQVTKVQNDKLDSRMEKVETQTNGISDSLRAQIESARVERIDTAEQVATDKSETAKQVATDKATALAAKP